MCSCQRYSPNASFLLIQHVLSTVSSIQWQVGPQHPQEERVHPRHLLDDARLSEALSSNMTTGTFKIARDTPHPLTNNTSVTLLLGSSDRNGLMRDEPYLFQPSHFWGWVCLLLYCNPAYSNYFSIWMIYCLCKRKYESHIWKVPHVQRRWHEASALDAM